MEIKNDFERVFGHLGQDEKTEARKIFYSGALSLIDQMIVHKNIVDPLKIQPVILEISEALRHK